MDYWKDVPGIDDVLDGKKCKEIIEAAGLDTTHLQRSCEMMADDFKRGEKEEKAMVPALKWMESRLNQSFPDGDVTDSDLQDLCREVGGRKVLKKAGMSSLEFINMITGM
jgi:hypothetical protein